MSTFQTYAAEEVWFPSAEAINGWTIADHLAMLGTGDQIRLDAYTQAIGEIVTPGMIVADIGTGTGFLAKLALQAGAKKVYGIDFQQEILKVAVQDLALAGFDATAFQTIHAQSTRTTLPERVDLVISELLGNMGDNEHMAGTLNHAYSNFLKPGGQMLPLSASSYLVPVTSQKAHGQITQGIYRTVNEGETIPFSDRFNIYYDVIIPSKRHLSAPQPLQTFDFKGNDPTQYQHNKTYTVTEAGTFTGFKGYFKAQLSRQTQLTTEHDDIEGGKTSEGWKHCYFPVQNTYEVAPGDQIQLTFSRTQLALLQQQYTWRGAIKRKGRTIHSFSQQMHDIACPS